MKSGAAQDRYRLFSVDRREWNPGDGSRVRVGAPRPRSLLLQLCCNPSGWTFRKTIFISIESTLRTTLCFHRPDYTLPLAVKMAEVARSQQLDLFHVHYAVPHALAACLASQIVGPSAPRIVTTLHGSDTTLLGQDPDYRTAIEHALVHSDAVTAVSESLRNQTQEIFRCETSRLK